MSKILLIKPRFIDLEFQIISHPMGIMYVGAALKKAGHEVKIHDCCIDCGEFHIFRQIITDWKPDFIGISIIVTEVEYTKRIMVLIKEMLPNVPVTFGGPWPSTDPEKAIRTFGANFVVLGEGEKVFLELISAINQRCPTESIPGTASLVGNDVVINQRPHLTEDELNDLPFPAWELLDHSLYAKMFSHASIGCRPYMTIITSRGCPFKCAYCHQTMGKVFRKRTAASVLAEIETLHSRYGFKEFEIVDDCFNLDRERMKAILTGIKQRFSKVKLHFPNGLRADLLEPGDMDLFKKAGTVSAMFAIETSSLRLQKMIHKNLNINKAVLTINAAVKAGIYSTGFFMIGFPTETYNEASATIDFAVSTSLHRAYFSNPTPYVGTKMAEMVSDAKKMRTDELNPLDLNPVTSTLNISAMSDCDLQMIFRRAYRHFYLNPKRILRMVIHHPNLLSLPRYAKIFLLKILPRK